MASLLNFFGLNGTGCPYHHTNNSQTKTTANGNITRSPASSENIANLVSAGLPLALVAGSINSLVAIAFRTNPKIPGLIGLVTVLTSHSIDMVCHLVNEKHHHHTCLNVARYSFNLLFSLCLFRFAADLSPIRFTPLMKTCFVLIPNAMDIVIQSRYFHAHRDNN